MTANAAMYQEMFLPTPSGFAGAWRWVRQTLNEEGFIDFVAKLSPWLAPLPSAFFVFDATQKHLHTGVQLSWVIAIVIETLGLTTTHTALSMHGWNRAHEDQPEKQSPFILAVCLALVYILATLSLIGVLEIRPDWQHYAPAMFPLLAVVGAVNLALRSLHNQRVRDEHMTVVDERQRQREIEDEDRNDRREERRIKIAAKYGLTVNQPSIQAVNLSGFDRQNLEIDSQSAVRLTAMQAAKMSKIDSRRQQLLAIVASESTIELAELQRRLSVGSVNTIKADIATLVEQGRLTFENRTFKATT